MTVAACNGLGDVALAAVTALQVVLLAFIASRGTRRRRGDARASHVQPGDLPHQQDYRL